MPQPSTPAAGEPKRTRAQESCERYAVVVQPMWDNLVAWAATPPEQSADHEYVDFDLYDAVTRATFAVSRLAGTWYAVKNPAERLRYALIAGKRGAALNKYFVALEEGSAEAVRDCARIGRTVPGFVRPPVSADRRQGSPSSPDGGGAAVGAEGTGAFDNDDASDIVATLEGLSDEQARTAAQRLFDDALAPGGLENASVASEAVAVAGLIALARDPGLAAQVAPPPLGLPAVAQVLAVADPAPAVRALERVLQPQGNELHDLWQEAHRLDDAQAQVRAILAALARPPVADGHR